MSKMIRVTMPDGSKWDVRAELVASNRAKYYAEQESSQEDRIRVFAEEYEYTLDDRSELLDWAANNMNWSDVSSEAVFVSEPPKLSAEDFQEGWINGDKEVIEQPD